MNLTLLKDNPLKDVILQGDGQPLYSIDSPWRMSGYRTTIRRLDTSIESAPANFTVEAARRIEGPAVGYIEWHSFSKDQLNVNGRNIIPVRSGFMRTSETFFASDGVEYKWSFKSGDLVLTVNNPARTPVALYMPSSRRIFSASKPARIEISQQGLNILDEIIATWVWMERKRRQRNNNSAASAGAAASASAAASANASASASASGPSC